MSNESRESFKRICIFGAGAISGSLGAHLARPGCDVSVVARGEAVAAIQPSEPCSVRACR